jgi:methylated-DNA-[protein]-cysteine S-methyltransferase
MANYTCKWESPLGGITIASDGVNITGLWFEGQKYFASTLEKENETKDLPIFEQTKEWLRCYFSGKEPNFTPPISFIGTEFRKEVWKILCKIPYGQVATYGEIAKIIATKQGKEQMSAQAVGNAVGHNPISIIVPCHRVIGSDSSLTGYAGGLTKKIKLLSLEGNIINAQYKVTQ